MGIEHSPGFFHALFESSSILTFVFISSLYAYLETMSKLLRGQLSDSLIHFIANVNVWSKKVTFARHGAISGFYKILNFEFFFIWYPSITAFLSLWETQTRGMLLHCMDNCLFQGFHNIGGRKRKWVNREIVQEKEDDMSVCGGSIRN